MEYMDKARQLVAQMTLEEKCSLLSGLDFWHTKPVERLGLPSVLMTDGPHGLRKQVDMADCMGLNKSVPSTCFPPAAASACSFNRQLLRQIGSAVGEEARQEDISVVLGPGLNIKRSPLCGRNFEYFSEDPFLSGELATAFVAGIQGQGVGASVKHFCCNNQETRRMTASSQVDMRTLREIYLSGFERVIRTARPWTVMCSYNPIRGVYASDNHWLLTDVLRNQWGYKGLVVSDWGAVNDRVAGIKAGLDLEMPYCGRYHDQEAAAAVESGALSMEELDACAERVTALVLRSSERQKLLYDRDAHHQLARQAAAESAVLLKNQEDMLPLKNGASIAVLGAFADTPRYQGSGSSRIVPNQLDNALSAFAATNISVAYAPGYSLDNDEVSEALLHEAELAAAGKDAVVIFAGLPDSYESEGFDRETLSMPRSHIQLIERASKVNPRICVVLSGGSVIQMDWEAHAKAILMGYLGGEAGASAIVDLLTGEVCPSGKLAESWPYQLKDVPCSDYFPGNGRTVEYREGLFVGYRYYDTAKMPVRYPFGYGLSYTSFAYEDLQLSTPMLSAGETLTVSCTVRNTGSLPGSETAQLYISHQNPHMICVAQELKGFEKLRLAPGECKKAVFTLTAREFSYFNVREDRWCVDGGEYQIRIGASSRDIRLSTVVKAAADGAAPDDLRNQAPCYYDLTQGLHPDDASFAALYGASLPVGTRIPGSPHDRNSSVSEIQDRPIGRLIAKVIYRAASSLAGGDDGADTLLTRILPDAPLRMLCMSGTVGPGVVEGLVSMLNGRFFKGLKQVLTWQK